MFSRLWGRPTNPITNLHDAGVIVGPLGIVLLIFGLVSTGALALGARLGVRDARWFGFAVALAAVAAAAFVIGGIVFGY